MKNFMFRYLIFAYLGSLLAVTIIPENTFLWWLVLTAGVLLTWLHDIAILDEDK